jgi:hypothetical protein
MAAFIHENMNLEDWKTNLSVFRKNVKHGLLFLFDECLQHESLIIREQELTSALTGRFNMTHGLVRELE